MQSMTTIRTIPTVIQLKPTTLDFHSGALARGMITKMQLEVILAGNRIATGVS